MRSSPSFTHLFILSSKQYMFCMCSLDLFSWTSGTYCIRFKFFEGIFQVSLKLVLQAVLSHHVCAGNHWAISPACWPLLLSFSLSIPNLIRTFYYEGISNVFLHSLISSCDICSLFIWPINFIALHRLNRHWISWVKPASLCRMIFTCSWI